ncbi:uncharacterized protein LOC115728457 [Rhodamnia argentea]|uniref:Uncharacterized protein LOC115728457 n=1 Tax=Rhodamnia argentea TaxID=178133 RepID=A0A8B8MX16_9MYRT|nr:uncharacterized protein LOC115728457 [Rhodamnia argentea]
MCFHMVQQRGRGNLVKKRLDRAVCNLAWRLAFPSPEVLALLAIGSDHSPILLSLSGVKVKRKKSFKFELFWLQSKQGGRIIKDVWEESACTGADLVETLKTLSATLEIWSKKEFPNSKNQRRQRNKILMLKVIGRDTWIRNPSRLKEMTSNFFIDLYSSFGPQNFNSVLAQCPKLVPDDMNVALAEDVMLEEVRRAFFEMGSEKAPGPDGLNGLFYQRKRENIKAGVFKEVKGFFNTGGRTRS